MFKTEFNPFQHYLSNVQNTTIQTIPIEGGGTIELLYDYTWFQLAIVNTSLFQWSLTANIEVMGEHSEPVSSYPVNLTVPTNYHVYLNQEKPIDPNPALEVKTYPTACFFKDLSLVSELAGTSFQWDACLKRMPNNVNRLLMQGSQISTVPLELEKTSI